MSRARSKFNLGRIVAAFALAAAAMATASSASAYAFGNSGGAGGTVFLTLDGTSIESFENSKGQATIGAYAADGTHSSTNTNYIVEGAGDALGQAYNNFFVFDLAGITAPITSASLTLFSYDDSTSFTYQVGSFTGNTKSLLNGTGGTKAYQALGKGTVFGVLKITSEDSNQFVTLNLNQKFINAINEAIAKRDPYYVLGGTQGQAGTPEPGTWALMLLGIGGVGAAMRRSRKLATAAAG